ncbi:MAG: TetR/AcrR family transcriptional regulator [Verrucomicrobiae bacterium]|nr:TetR/AcrR family transcriptional regulator [Verrucomicrobiae bacterium]MCB1088712.1 TetR/AcrR family transcriptional regulator [Verrucomicrobiae bacterium]
MESTVTINPPPEESAVSRRRERDRSLREADFLAAAEQLFAEKGFHGASMEEIASAAGYGTGTLYLYFKSKGDLYQRLIEMRHDAYLAGLNEAIGATDDPGDRLRAVVRYLFSFFRKERRFLAIYVSEFLSGHDRLSAGLGETALKQRGACDAVVESVVRDGIAAGAIRPLDPELIKATLDGLCESLLPYSVLRGEADIDSAERMMLHVVESAFLLSRP